MKKNYPVPTKEEIKAARKSMALTQEEAGHMVKTTRRTWQSWESGIAPMEPGLWVLFKLKLEDMERRLLTRISQKHLAVKVDISELLENATD